jgi:hypothetical protein
MKKLDTVGLGDPNTTVQYVAQKLHYNVMHAESPSEAAASLEILYWIFDKFDELSDIEEHDPTAEHDQLSEFHQLVKILV